MTKLMAAASSQTLSMWIGCSVAPVHLQPRGVAAPHTCAATCQSHNGTAEAAERAARPRTAIRQCPYLSGAACAALNQFNKALDKNQAATLFKLLLKYQPEAKAEKRERLTKEAEAREAGQARPLPFPAPLCTSPQHSPVWPRRASRCSAAASVVQRSGGCMGRVDASGTR